MASNLNSRHTAISVPAGALERIVFASMSTTTSAMAPSAVTSAMAWRQRISGWVGTLYGDSQPPRLKKEDQFYQYYYDDVEYDYLPDGSARLRTDKIPSDVLYLDIDYQYKNRPFTVDPNTFPNFPALVSDLRKQHFHLVTITDLHIAHAPGQGYAPYDSGAAGDHFVKNPDGSEFIGVVWPGRAVFPDFTRAGTRDWWGGLYKKFVQDGVAGFWNDMNEPSVFDGFRFAAPVLLCRVPGDGVGEALATADAVVLVPVVPCC